MLKFLNVVKVLVWSSIFILLFSALALTAVYQNDTAPTWKEYQNSNNISPHFTSKERHAIKKSRDSVVMIRSTQLSIIPQSSSMSGTYFSANGKKYVITAHHGLVGPCALTLVISDEHALRCKEYIIMDKENDYAVIELEGEFSDRIPVSIPEDLPSSKEWKRSYSLLNRIVYTGYPNIVGPLTLRGDVVGYTNNEYLYVFSHAYTGASGSGVFSLEGKYIGQVIAIDVGSTEFGPDVLENIVIVFPAVNVDWDTILTN
jgi:hypothetical protein